MKNTLRIVFILFLFTSCSKKESDPYYKWTLVDGYKPDVVTYMLFLGDEFIVCPNRYEIRTSRGDYSTWKGMQFSPFDNVSCMTKYNGAVYIGDYDKGVWYSTDFDKNQWVNISAGLPDDSPGFPQSGKASINQVHVNEAGIYACNDSLSFSADNGSTWSNIGVPGTRKTLAVGVDENIVYASFEGAHKETKVYRSADNGLHWHQLKNLPGTRIDHIYIADHVIYATSHSYYGTLIYASQDRGDTWVTGKGTDLAGKTYFTDFASLDGEVYVCSPTGVYKSKDHGVSWTFLGGFGVQCLAIKDRVLYAGGRRIYRRMLDGSL